MVIPVWGAYAQSLPAALQSLSGDLSVVDRILVVDNASEAPVRVFAHPLVSVLRTAKRLSLGEARNAGLLQVDSELVCFIDADDTVQPGMLSQLVALMQASSLAALISSPGDPASGTPYRFPPQISYRLLSQGRQRSFRWLNLVRPLYSPVGTGVIRTEAFRLCGGFPASSNGEDWAAGATLAFSGTVGLDPRIGRWYDPAPDSLSRSAQSTRQILSRRLMLDRWLLSSGLPLQVKLALPLLIALQLIDALWLRERR